MSRIIGRLLIAGSFVASGVAHRRVGEVGERIDAVERSVTDIDHWPALAGMPLPTGYGLLVQGRAGEDIVVPVCLPPGFELGSLVLRPDFPAGGACDQHRLPPAVPTTQAASRAQPGPVTLARAVITPPGEQIRIVYGDEPGYRHRLNGESTVELDASIL